VVVQPVANLPAMQRYWAPEPGLKYCRRYLLVRGLAVDMQQAGLH
jgi:hypothetical protein